MYHHDRQAHKKYLSFPRSNSCDFCDPPGKFKKIIAETAHAWIVENRVAYTQWELRKVTEHLMVFPKSHVLTLNELSQDARIDIINVMAQYEADGYEIYARAPTSSTRSVPHQHTHLIKAEPKIGRGLLYWGKPRILWLFR